MKTHEIVKLALLFFLAACMPLNHLNGRDKDNGRPNVIIILTDDNGYGDHSFSGNPMLKTPHIDRLSRQGIHFTNFHVAPMCTPTRGQLMTGMDALHNGAFLVCSGYTAIYPEVPTMAEIFRDAGYRTGIFGKWHLGDGYPYRPMDRGFEKSVWHKGWGVTSTSDYWNNDYFDDKYYINDSLCQFKGYCTDIWFEEAMKWMKECSEEGLPFLAYIPTNAPHGPFYVEDSYREPYMELGKPLASHFGMIANIDENMERLDLMLKKNKLMKNTILIYMTDNGATIGQKYFNAGLKDGKESLYDGGHRVPCLLRWPGGDIQQKIENDQILQVQDILPTLMEFCSIKQEYDFDGSSFAPLARGKIQEELDSRMMVVQYGRQPFTKLEIPKKYDACVMWNKWRLVSNKELYDVSRDRGQENDLAAQYPEIVQKMSRFYEDWWKETEHDVYHRFNPIYLGTEEEPVAILNAHDWLTINTANHARVKDGFNRSGAWNIRVTREGTYRIELCRWPKEANLKITESCPAYQAVDALFREGLAIPARKASLRIGIQEYAIPVSDEDYAATFEIFLKKGDTTLETNFYDKRGNRLCGAYYVYATLTDD